MGRLLLQPIKGRNIMPQLLQLQVV
ncbi:UNVERIFIED_CONTAM: hypothetical protein GTU68_050430 [Idotea baltica]|nr:hypothetical protein [Idotea baltica]